MSARSRRLLVLVSMLVPCACTSVEWQEVPVDLQQPWRDRKVYQAADAFVLATDEDHAADSYLQVARVVDTMRDVAGMAPGRGLVVAVSAGDPPLVDDPMDWLIRAAGWHSQCLGSRQTGAARKSDLCLLLSGRIMDGKKAAVDPAIFAQIWCGGVPRTTTELNLPQPLLARSRWILIVPTRRCLADASSRLVDSMIAAADLNFFQGMMVAPFLPSLKGSVADEMRDQSAVAMFRVCFAHVQASAEERQAALARCLDHESLADAASGRMSKRSRKLLQDGKHD